MANISRSEEGIVLWVTREYSDASRREFYPNSPLKNSVFYRLFAAPGCEATFDPGNYSTRLFARPC
jgi:hypothetical protein